MEIELLLKDQEETLEHKLDRINITLQNTMKEIEIAEDATPSQSQFSRMHSFATSYCHFEWLEAEHDVSAVEIKFPEGFEETFETVLQALDRSQMLVEDFWAESIRISSECKSKNDDVEEYISKLERENRELRRGEYQNKNNIILNLKRSPALEQERENVEERLEQLDALNDFYKLRYKQLTQAQESLKIKEELLTQKENDLRLSKFEFEKTRMAWEKSVVSNTLKKTAFKSNDIGIGIDCLVEEAPPPLALTPNRNKEISELQQELKKHEIKFRELSNDHDRSKAISFIDQLKNKIAGLRGEQAIFESVRSCKLIKSMNRTVENEVNHEENLRKINLERFTIKGANKLGQPFSATPRFASISSKKFLFPVDRT